MRSWITLRRAIAALLLLPLLAGCVGHGEVRELTLLHMSDLHARLEPDAEGRGGFAYLATALEQQRADAPAHLTLFAGDMVQGSPVSTLFRGLPIFEIGNGLGIDVGVPGNHDFDYGWQRLEEFAAVANYEFISANVVDAQGRRLFEPPYVLRSLNGIDVAIVGAMTEELDSLVTSEKRGPWRAAPLVATLRPIVERLDDQVDLVVVLGHIGLEEQQRLLEAIPGIDVVIGGHEHEGRESALVRDGRLAVSAQAYGRVLGRLDLEVDTGTDRIASFNWRQVPVVARELAADPKLQQQIEQWEARVAAIVDVPIAQSERAFSREELRQFVEQTLKEATGTPAAYAETGWIRDELPAGTILARHVWNLMPFDNEIVVVRFPDGGLPAELKERPEINADPLAAIATADYEAQRWRDRGFDLEIVSTDMDLRQTILERIQQTGLLR